MKKCVCVDEWRWGTVDKRIVYGGAALFFTLGIIIDTIASWDLPTDSTRLILTTFNLLGFSLMVFYQFLNRWIIGVILVTLIAMVSMVPFCRAVQTYQFSPGINI